MGHYSKGNSVDVYRDNQAYNHLCSCDMVASSKPKGCRKKLDHIQRLACLHITGAVRTTPTSALEIIIGLIPLPIHIQQEAMLACYRLKANSQWVQTTCGHTGINNHLKTNITFSLMRSDRIVPRYIFDKIMSCAYLVEMTGMTMSLTLQTTLSVILTAQDTKCLVMQELVYIM